MESRLPHLLPFGRGTAMMLPSHLGALVAYTALAIGLTWPLLLRLGSAVPHDLGDPLSFVWILWWNAQALPLTSRWLHAPVFHPSTGAIVYQDSLVGLWPVTTPLQWMGASPLAAYNVLLIASFALSAFTAYLLCARLVGDRPAAFCGGLAFGFALYRVAQLAHVNILLTFWVPLVLLALHEYHASRKGRWLALAAACWAVQGLTSGYFLVYGTVLVGGWALFFARGDVRMHARLAGAFALGLAAIWPWLSLYRSVHETYGFRRGLGEAEFYGADVAGLIKASPLLAAWGPALGDATREEQLFPGLTLAFVCLATVASARCWRGRVASRATVVFLCVALVFGAAAAIAAWAPMEFRLLGAKVSLVRAYKPLGMVWLALLAAFASSLPVRRIVAGRSVGGFYALCALALWILSLGPTVRFMGERIWYKAPYSWLAVLPGFDAVRVPARLWLLASLALAAVCAWGLAKFGGRVPRARTTAVALAALGLAGETWLSGLPLHDPPERIALLEARRGRFPVLELPLGEVERDTAAMYRGIFHGAPVVNGYSGHLPRSYDALRIGLEHDDPGALVAFAERAALDVLVDAAADAGPTLEGVVQQASASFVSSAGRYRLYHLPRRPPVVEPAPTPAARIRIVASGGRDATRRLTDRNPLTYEFARGDPSGPETAYDISIAEACSVNEVELRMTAGPARVAVLVPGKDGHWDERWSGLIAERLVRGALADPVLPRVRVTFSPAVVDRVRVVFGDVAADDYWSLQEVRVRGPSCAGGTD